MSKTYKITEHYVPKDDMPMTPGWYGFYSEYMGNKSTFNKLEPILLKRVYQVLLESSEQRKARGFHEVIQITKKKETMDELDVQFFTATVGIKWHESYEKEPS